jgi:hypothetical protein
VKYECKDCGFEWGEDDPTEHLICINCKSENIHNKTRARISNLENWFDNLEREVWKLQDKIKELENHTYYGDNDVQIPDELRILIIEYIQGTVEETIEFYLKNR